MTIRFILVFGLVIWFFARVVIGWIFCGGSGGSGSGCICGEEFKFLGEFVGDEFWEEDEVDEVGDKGEAEECGDGPRFGVD